MEKTAKGRKSISVILVLAIILSVVGIGFTGNLSASAAVTVTLVPTNSSSGYYCGKWITTADIGTGNGGGWKTHDSAKTVGPGTYYYLFANADIYWIGNDRVTVAIITVDSNGVPTVVDGRITTSNTLASTGGKTAQLNNTSGTSYTVSWGAPASTKPRGSGVSDTTLASWARIGTNSTVGLTGGARQAFSANSVKYLTEHANVGVPARTVSVSNPTSVSIKGSDTGISKSYSQMAVDSSEYTDYYGKLKGRSDYTYDDYYINDWYCQGVWDAMPAKYGWQQNQWTEPGKFTKSLYSGIDDKGYAIAAGGQNPWVLMDYIERNASSLGWKAGYDEVQNAAYLWHEETGTFLTYENEISLNERCDYIDEMGLGGIIIWEMSGDNTATYPMTQILSDRLKSNGKRVVGYFTNWSCYNEYHQEQTPNDLPWDLMTHVNYSFYQVGGTYEHEEPAPDYSLNSMDRYADDYSSVSSTDAGKQLLKEAESQKALYPDTSLMISVGGWTRGDGFYEMIKSEANINTFVNSVISFLDKYPFFDGIDLDWEYPGNNRSPDFDDPNDRGSPGGGVDFANYILLIQKLRDAFDKREQTTGKYLQITACAPASPGNIRTQDIYSVANLCDFVNIMTYDYHGAFDPVGEITTESGVGTGEYYELGYNSPLYGRTTDKNDWSTANTIEYLIYKGIDPSKMNIGTPYYSRGWSGVETITDENGTSIPAGLTDPTPFDTTPADFDITISPKPETMAKGTTKQLELSFSTQASEAMYGDSVVWKSFDETMATVDQNGKVTAIATSAESLAAQGITTNEPDYVTIAAYAGNKTDFFRMRVTAEEPDPDPDPVVQYKSLGLKTWEAVSYYEEIMDDGTVNGIARNNEEDLQTINYNGGTMVPFRMMGNALGAEVAYLENDPTWGTAVIYALNGYALLLPVDSTSAYMLDLSTDIIVPYPIEGYEPLRIIGEQGYGRAYVHVRLIADKIMGVSCMYFNCKDEALKDIWANDTEVHHVLLSTLPYDTDYLYEYDRLLGNTIAFYGDYDYRSK